MGQFKTAYKKVLVKLGDLWLLAKCVEEGPKRKVCVVVQSREAVENDLVSLTVSLPHSRVRNLPTLRDLPKEQKANVIEAFRTFSRKKLADLLEEEKDFEESLFEEDEEPSVKRSSLGFPLYSEPPAAPVVKVDKPPVAAAGPELAGLLVWQQRASGSCLNAKTAGLCAERVGNFFEAHHNWAPDWGNDIFDLVFSFLTEEPKEEPKHVAAPTFGGVAAMFGEVDEADAEDLDDVSWLTHARYSAPDPPKRYRARGPSF